MKRAKTLLDEALLWWLTDMVGTESINKFGPQVGIAYQNLAEMLHGERNILPHHIEQISHAKGITVSLAMFDVARRCALLEARHGCKK